MLDLIDRQRRCVKYLRVGVTDRCNFRCSYCMPCKVDFLPRKDLLSFEEIESIVGMFVELGVTHVRITGGEPLARRDLTDLVRRLGSMPGVTDLSMTTNGSLLAPHASALVDAGLERINVSIDTIDPDRFCEITRGGRLESVLAGIRAARDAGLQPVKLNAVLVRGINHDEAGDLIRFARDEGLVMRFIEFMPIGEDGWWKQGRFLKIDEMRTTIEAEGFRVEPMGNAAERPVGGGPARYWNVTPPEGGTPQPVGFIAALTHNFCAACNRVRLSSSGRVRECLTAGGTLSLRDMLRSGTPREAVVAAIRHTLYGKVDGHRFDARSVSGGIRAGISMSELGG